MYNRLFCFIFFAPFFIKSASISPIFLSSANGLIYAAEKTQKKPIKTLELYYGALSFYTTTYHQEQCPILKISMHDKIKQLHHKTQTIIEQIKKHDKTSDYILSPEWDFVDTSVRTILDTPMETKPLFEKLHEKALKQQILNISSKEISSIEKYYHQTEDLYNKQIIAGHLLCMANSTSQKNNLNISIDAKPIIEKSKQLIEHSKPITTSINLPDRFLSEVANQYYHDLWNMWYAYQHIENLYERYQISKNIALLLPFIDSLCLNKPSWYTLKNLWTHHLVSTQDMLVHLHIPLIEEQDTLINPHTLNMLNAIYEESTYTIDEKEHLLSIACQLIQKCNNDNLTKSQKDLWEKRFKESKYNPDYVHFYATQIYSIIGNNHHAQKKFNDAKKYYFKSIRSANNFLKNCNQLNESKQAYELIKHMCLKLSWILDKRRENNTILFNNDEMNLLYKSLEVIDCKWLNQHIKTIELHYEATKCIEILKQYYAYKTNKTVNSF
ncbi:MAG: hypothetical protein WD055_01720 [Candidatus Dependentiae bacterium]